MYLSMFLGHRRNAFQHGFWKLDSTLTKFVAFWNSLYLSYHKVQHTKILRSIHTVHLCGFLRISEQIAIISYTALTDWFV
jgi:hypothetical protein